MNQFGPNTMSPFDIQEARAAARAASETQRLHEESYTGLAKQAAEAEEEYRIALAHEIVRQHNDEGVAWTVAPDLARGNKTVAGLRKVRDMAVGVLEAAQQAGWRHTADRKDLGRFIDWSMRRELAEGGQPPLQPDGETFGRRAAA